MGSIQRREMVLHIREQLSELVRLLWSPGAGATQQDSFILCTTEQEGEGFYFAMQLVETLGSQTPPHSGLHPGQVQDTPSGLHPVLDFTSLHLESTSKT